MKKNEYADIWLKRNTRHLIDSPPFYSEYRFSKRNELISSQFRLNSIQALVSGYGLAFHKFFPSILGFFFIKLA